MDVINKENVLYRYQSLNSYSEEFFTKKLIYFASPSEFNDPYDCKVVLPALKTSKDILKFFNELLDKSDSYVKRAIFLGGMKSALRDSKKWAELIEPFLKPVKAVIDNWGIFCLSEHNDNILMWSHYSDGHRGYCLEFDKTGLSRLGVCRKVNYRISYPIVSDFHSDSGTVGNLCTFSKASQWEYEKEWRVLVDPKQNPKLPGSRHYEIPEGLLTGIIFGCEMPLENRETIVAWLKNWKTPIKFYEAVKKTDEYGVKIISI